jgi:hypothetical protein
MAFLYAGLFTSIQVWFFFNHHKFFLHCSHLMLICNCFFISCKLNYCNIATLINVREWSSFCNKFIINVSILLLDFKLLIILLAPAFWLKELDVHANNYFVVLWKINLVGFWNWIVTYKDLRFCFFIKFVSLNLWNIRETKATKSV